MKVLIMKKDIFKLQISEERLFLICLIQNSQKHGMMFLQELLLKNISLDPLIRDGRKKSIQKSAEVLNILLFILFAELLISSLIEETNWDTLLVRKIEKLSEMN